MPFQDPPSKTLVLPEGNPAIPGFDSLVFGTELPVELRDAGYLAAQVFYHGAFDPTITKSQVKYYYIAMIRTNNGAAYPSGMDIGYVWVTNPAVNSTGVIRIAFQQFHDGRANTVNGNILPNNVPGAILSIGQRLVLDTDNGILEFRPSDLAYPRVGCINFANGFYNNAPVVGQPAYAWCKKDATGTIHLQALFGMNGSVTGPVRICDVPFNTYAPKGNIYISAISQPNAFSVCHINTIGQIWAQTNCYGYFGVNTSWVTSP